MTSWLCDNSALSDITMYNPDISLHIFGNLSKQLTKFINDYRGVYPKNDAPNYTYIYMGLEDTFTDIALATPTKQPTILFTLADLPLN